MSTQSTLSVGEIVHRLPGRLRVRFALLRCDPVYARDLKHAIVICSGGDRGASQSTRKFHHHYLQR